MRIAMIGLKAIPFQKNGGVERHVESLGARLVARGHKVTVYVRPHYVSTQKNWYRGMRLMRISSIRTSRLDAISHTFLAAIHASFQHYDIIHIHGVGQSTLIWIIRLLSPQTKIVVTFHAIDRFNIKWGAAAKRFLSYGEWTATHLPDATIVVSKTLEAYCQNKFGKKTEYIPNGVEPTKTPNIHLLKKWKLIPGKYLVTVGRLIRTKGIHTLIKAFRGINTNMRLVIVGAPSYTQDYEQYLERVARKDSRIIFAGFQSGKILSALYAHAYLYVHPSEYEGLSLSILEAISHGAPALVSNIPENVEAIGKYGFTFQVRDMKDLRRKLSELLSNPERTRRTAASGRQWVNEHYNWDRITDRTEALYRRVKGQ